MSKELPSSPKNKPLSPEEYVANLSSTDRLFARIDFWLRRKELSSSSSSFEEATYSSGRCRGTPALRVRARLWYAFCSPFWRLSSWLRRGSSD